MPTVPLPLWLSLFLAFAAAALWLGWTARQAKVIATWSVALALVALAPLRWGIAFDFIFVPIVGNILLSLGGTGKVQDDVIMAGASAPLISITGDYFSGVHSLLLVAAVVALLAVVAKRFGPSMTRTTKLSIATFPTLIIMAIAVLTAVGIVPPPTG
jgi:hypothetical protein